MDLHKGYYSFIANETWAPSVNLYETDKAYKVCVDLAGVDKKKIDIEIVEQRLVLRGNRAVPICKDEGSPSSKPKLHLMEIDHGPFVREVELPQDVERENISAKYDNGMLWIELPKKSG
jgi:HSP20 family protein